MMNEAFAPNLYRNKKNGKLYRALREVLDCTNSRDGTLAILYVRADSGEQQFIRERGEFLEKFELVADPSSAPAVEDPAEALRLKVREWLQGWHSQCSEQSYQELRSLVG